MRRTNISRGEHSITRVWCVAVVCAVLACLVCSGASKEANTAVERALSLASSGNLGLALPLLERANRLYPNHPSNYEIMYQLGLAYLDAGKPDQAEKVFTTFTKLYGPAGDKCDRNDDVMIAMGRVMAGRKQYDEAVAHIKKFIETKRNSKSLDNAKLTLAAILIDENKIDEARKYLEVVASEASSSIHEQAMFLLAEATARQGKFDETEVLVRKIIKQSRDRNMRNAAYTKLGDIYRDSSNIVKALQAYRRIKDSSGTKEARELNAKVLLNIAKTFDQLGHPLEARLGYEGVATLFADTPLGTDAWCAAIQCDAAYGDFARAGETYQMFRTNYPGYPLIPAIRFYIGEQCMLQSRYSNAIEEFSAGLAEFPTGEMAEATYSCLGDAYLQAGKYDDAERTLLSFAKKFPASPQLSQSFYSLGETYLQQRRFTNALEIFTALGQNYAGSDVGRMAIDRIDGVRLLYGQDLLETNKFDAAIAQFKAVTSSNYIEEAELRIADAYMQVQNYSNAIIQFTDFLERYTNSTQRPAVALSLGDAYLRCDQYKEAEKAISTIFSMGLSPSNDLLPYAHYQIATCCYYAPSNDVARATNALNEIFDKYPNSPQAPDAYNLLSNILIDQQDYTAASEMLRILAQKYPNYPGALEAAYRAGEMLVLNRQAKNAVPMFIGAFQAHPESGWSLHALVRAGEVATDPLVFTNVTRMADWCARLDALGTGTPVAAAVCGLARAAVLMRAGDGTAARQACLPAEKATLPADIRGYALAIRAGAANAASNFTEGATLAAQAVQACGTASIGLDEALLQRARALFNQQKWNEARNAYSTVFSRIEGGYTIPNPRQAAQAYLECAQSLLELGAQNTNSIVAMCNKAVDQKAGFEFNARSGVIKGDTFFKAFLNGNATNDLNTAAQYYKQVVIRYSKLPHYAVPAYRNLINCLDRLGLTEEAARYRAEFAKRYPAAKTN